MSHSHFKWILGPAAAEKISFVAKQYYISRLSAINSTFGAGYTDYRPWMSSKAMAKNFIDHVPPSTKFEIAGAYLNDYAQRLQSCEDFTLFHEEAADPLEVYSEIAMHHPGSQEDFSRSVSLLSECSPWIHQLFEDLVRDVVPVRRKSSVFGAGSATNHHLIGTIFLGLRDNPNRLVKSVISLAHEIGHTSLMIYQNGDSITLEPENTLVYSPVRRVDRPLIMSFHAVVASGFMIECAKGLCLKYSATTSEFSYLQKLISDLSRELKVSLEQLAGKKVTPLGQHILDDVRQSIG